MTPRCSRDHKLRDGLSSHMLGISTGLVHRNPSVDTLHVGLCVGLFKRGLLGRTTPVPDRAVLAVRSAVSISPSSDPNRSDPIRSDPISPTGSVPSGFPWFDCSVVGGGTNEQRQREPRLSVRESGRGSAMNWVRANSSDFGGDPPQPRRWSSSLAHKILQFLCFLGFSRSTTVENC